MALNVYGFNPSLVLSKYFKRSNPLLIKNLWAEFSFTPTKSGS